jgi:hypothetical protein
VAMEKQADSDDELARQVVEHAWGHSEELPAVHVGLNRLTWKVGQDLWLTGIDEARVEILQRENALFRAVGAACASAGLPIEVPVVVKALEGEDIARRGGRAFRATAHIDGVRPDDNRPETFVGSMRVLRRLHPLLREIPSDLAVLGPGLSEVADLLARCLGDPWDPVTRDVAERASVCRAAEWLAPRLARLEEAPRQLVHGDWATPNLLVRAPRTGTVVAVLDWQLCSVGPVVTDIAQAVAGALMWSRLAIEPVVDSIFAAYGTEADRRLVGPAMVAYWFRNYWWVRDEAAGDERHRATIDRQPGRLRSVMSFVETLAE